MVSCHLPPSDRGTSWEIWPSRTSEILDLGISGMICVYPWDSMAIAMTTVMICSPNRLFVPQMQDHPIEEVMEYIDWTPFFQAPWLPPMSKWWRCLCCLCCFWMFLDVCGSNNTLKNHEKMKTYENTWTNPTGCWYASWMCVFFDVSCGEWDSAASQAAWRAALEVYQLRGKYPNRDYPHIFKAQIRNLESSFEHSVGPRKWGSGKSQPTDIQLDPGSVGYDNVGQCMTMYDMWIQAPPWTHHIVEVLWEDNKRCRAGCSRGSRGREALCGSQGDVGRQPRMFSCSDPSIYIYIDGILIYQMVWLYVKIYHPYNISKYIKDHLCLPWFHLWTTKFRC